LLRFFAILAAILVPGLAAAQSLPPCEVGRHLDRAGALNYPGTIVDYDSAKGSYLIRWDDGGSEEWLGASSLSRGCVIPASAGPGVDWFYGYWTDNLISGGPALYVGSNGSYEWVHTTGGHVEGQWRKASRSELKATGVGEAIVLLDAIDGYDWVAQTQNQVDSRNRELMLITRSDGAAYQYVYREE
jgi:hypothetical protein